jgi:hypothetical protein
MTGVEPWNVPRSEVPQGPAKRSLYEGNTYIQDVFGGGSDRPGVEAPRFHPQRLTTKFTASTCRKCGAITIAGLTYGLRVDLEPQVLDDETEYAALLDGVPTYDLWPDRIARRRHLENIRQPDKAPRHARHTCGTTYGTQPRPTPATNPRPTTDGPPPF